MIRIVAKRYAKALVDLCEEKKSIDAVRADMTAFVDAVKAQPDMQRLFASPAITTEGKKAVIGELSTRLKLNTITRRFIEHLAESGRIRQLSDVHAAFEDILAERQNRAFVRLTSATPVNGDYLSEMKRQLETMTGKKVDIDVQVDPALIGGVKAQIGSVIYDGTIKNQLNKMRDQLVK